MANRIVPVETRVKVMNDCLRLIDVERFAARDDVSPDAIYYWFERKLKPLLSDISVNKTPDRKPRPSSREEASEPASDKHLMMCDQRGGARMWKNGFYEVINWVWLLTLGWLVTMITLYHRMRDCQVRFSIPAVDD